tara:strand:+ start:418 stop:561 length:144 start_codon:yes stop_codon:yes gene_type:complete
MGENDRPFVQIPLPPPEWEEYIRKAREQEEQDKEDLDDNRGVIIIDI